jgi:Asp/Glu/hydantoin racemase
MSPRFRKRPGWATLTPDIDLITSGAPQTMPQDGSPVPSPGRKEIVLLNANTTAAITARLLAAATPANGDGIVFRGVTAPFGDPYISTPAGAARAAEAVGAVVAEIGAATPLPAALVIACFGDPGLWAARAALPVPVIGMAEASCHIACQLGRRFAIVTGGAAWGPMLRDFVAMIGLAGRLADVRTLELTGAEIAARPAAAADSLLAEAEAAAAGGADVVILGGAGLVGIAATLGRRTRVRLLDSLDCAVAQARMMVSLAAAA